MQDWIKTVFVDDQYYGGMETKKLAEVKEDFRQYALRILKDTGADHVIYCHIEYDTDDNIKALSLCNGLSMDDKTFHERTRTIPSSDFIGAVHKLY